MNKFEKITQTTKHLAELIASTGNYSEYCCDMCNNRKNCYKDTGDNYHEIFDPPNDDDSYCVDGIKQWLESEAEQQYAR